VDLADNQAVNFRLLVQRQKMHRSQRCYSELAEPRVDDICRQIADAGDQKYCETPSATFFSLTCVRSSFG